MLNKIMLCYVILCYVIFVVVENLAILVTMATNQIQRIG